MKVVTGVAVLIIVSILVAIINEASTSSRRRRRKRGGRKDSAPSEEEGGYQADSESSKDEELGRGAVGGAPLHPQPDIFEEEEVRVDEASYSSSATCPLTPEAEYYPSSTRDLPICETSGGKRGGIGKRTEQSRGPIQNQPAISARGAPSLSSGGPGATKPFLKDSKNSKYTPSVNDVIEFDELILAVSWKPGASAKFGKRTRVQENPGLQWIIHGLWIDNDEVKKIRRAYVNSNRNLYPDLKINMDSQLALDMAVHWPSVFGLDANNDQNSRNIAMWSHEWNLHGKTILKKEIDSGNIVGNGVQEYFSRTLELFNRSVLPKLKRITDRYPPNDAIPYNCQGIGQAIHQIMGVNVTVNFISGDRTFGYLEGMYICVNKSYKVINCKNHIFTCNSRMLVAQTFKLFDSLRVILSWLPTRIAQVKSRRLQESQLLTGWFIHALGFDTKNPSIIASARAVDVFETSAFSDYAECNFAVLEEKDQDGNSIFNKLKPQLSIGMAYNPFQRLALIWKRWGRLTYLRYLEGWPEDETRVRHYFQIVLDIHLKVYMHLKRVRFPRRGQTTPLRFFKQTIPESVWPQNLVQFICWNYAGKQYLLAFVVCIDAQQRPVKCLHDPNNDSDDANEVHCDEHVYYQGYVHVESVARKT